MASILLIAVATRLGSLNKKTGKALESARN